MYLYIKSRSFAQGDAMHEGWPGFEVNIFEKPQKGMSLSRPVFRSLQPGVRSLDDASAWVKKYFANNGHKAPLTIDFQEGYGMMGSADHFFKRIELLRELQKLTQKIKSLQAQLRKNKK